MQPKLRKAGVSASTSAESEINRIAGRTVTLSGTVRQMSRAFAVDLGYESRSGDHRGLDGFVYVPRELSGIVHAVFGLDNRRIPRVHLNLSGRI
jgi:hypothetical protein